MIQPASASAPTGAAGGPLHNIIDQSGLNTPYVSGVTSFDTYTATETAEWSITGDWSEVMSGSTQPPSALDFDLGTEYIVDAVAVWNNTGTASVLDFDILISPDASFTSTTSLGSFTIAVGTSTTAEPAQVNRFSPTTARYIRMWVTRNAGFPNTRINEIAFGGTPVPEPGTVGLVLGGVTVVLMRRR